MDSSTLERWQEMSETGVVYELGSLYDRIQQLKDPRKAQGKRYSLVTLVIVILLAKLCNQDSPVAIADWAKNHAETLKERLKLSHDWMPHHNTIRRVFANILDEAEFERLVSEYHQSQAGQGDQLALDGKALRGTRIAEVEKADIAVSVYDIQTQRVVAQAMVETKENEIVAAPKALEQVELAGKVITGDAMHTQRAISAEIVRRNGDYLWVVKENQGRLYQDIQHLFAPDIPKPGFGRIPTDFQHHQTVNSGHGRIEKRLIQTSEMLNDYLDWPGVGQVYRLERTFQWRRAGKVIKTSQEVEYGITSLTRTKATAKRVLQVRRQHWRIETGLHYCRDVTFHEDATRMTQAAAGRILAMIHNLALGLIKHAGFQNAAQARRYFDGHIDQAFSLLLAGTSLS